MTTRGRNTTTWLERVLLAVVGATALLQACAGSAQSDNARMTALERRVAELEAAHAPRKTPRAPSAAAVPDVEAPISEDAAAPGNDAAQATPDASSLPMFELCMVEAERSCLQRARQPAPVPGKLEWQTPRKVRAARDTPEGRACLALQQIRCKKRLGHEDRIEQLFAWLDAQLGAKSLDATYSKQVQSALLKLHPQLSPADLRVDCVAQFCRVTGPAVDSGVVEMDVSRVIDGRQGMRRGGRHYVTRGDYSFPIP
ncbi:MAG: hypothetical protein R3B13_34535 [Polyangiaceae bacterium]